MREIPPVIERADRAIGAQTKAGIDGGIGTKGTIRAWMTPMPPCFTDADGARGFRPITGSDCHSLIHIPALDSAESRPDTGGHVRPVSRMSFRHAKFPMCFQWRNGRRNVGMGHKIVAIYDDS